MTIDPEGDVLIYVQLADLLRGQIDRGEIPEHRPIPSKKTMLQEHGTAQGTVERALTVLKDEGYIRTVLGRGMYVVLAAERHKAR